MMMMMMMNKQRTLNILKHFLGLKPLPVGPYASGQSLATAKYEQCTVAAFSLLRQLEPLKRVLCDVDVTRRRRRRSAPLDSTRHDATNTRPGRRRCVVATNGRQNDGTKHIPVMSCNHPLKPASIAGAAATDDQAD